MSSDVFICYDQKDEKIAEEICSFLEKNNKNCWFKKRDYGEDDTVFTISEEIKSSKSFVLLYSKDAKESNYVTTELDIAFSSEIPIIAFKIDDGPIGEKQQFYLKDKPIIEAYPNPGDFYKELDSDVSKLTGSSADISSSQNEAYICYSDEDELAAEAICHVLEENGIKSWFKKRDLSVKDGNEKIIETIKNSKSFILIHSKDALNSNYVNAEVNFALGENIPILSFQIDESDKLDNLEGAHWLDAYPNPEENFKQLVLDTANLIDKPIDNPKISNKYKIIKKEPKTESKKEPIKSKTQVDKSSKEFTKNYGLGKHFKKILVVVIIIAAICIAGVYFYTNGLTFLGKDNQVVMSDSGVSLEEKGPVNSLEMVTTKVRLHDNHCKVWAKLYTTPDNFENYKIDAKYYDESGNVIATSSKLMGEIEEDDGQLIIIDYTSDKLIDNVEFTIYDDTGKQVFYQIYNK